MDDNAVLAVTPADSVADATAYQIPRLPQHVDLRLGATERVVVSDPLRAFHQSLDHRLACEYPEPHLLEALLAERLGVPAQRVMVTAGADEAIDRACRAVLGPGRELIMADPTFEMIGHYAKLAGADATTVAWDAGDFPVDAVLALASDRTSAVAVVTPNNPTGLPASAGAIERLARALPKALIIVDMAYAEYAGVDITATVLGLPNAVMTRTLSKAWGMPGLRTGYAVAHPRVLDWMRAAGGPYSVARPSLTAAASRLRSGDAEMRSYVARVRDERQALRALVLELGGQAEASEANFVLARFANAAWVREALAGLGIGVRTFPANPRLRDALRITCPGDEVAFARLQDGLRTALKPEALIFDLDGVLADVSGSYRASIIATAQTFGVDITGEQIAAIKAKGGANNDWEVTQRMLRERGVEASLDEVTARFERIYQGHDGAEGLRSTERLLLDRAVLQAWAERLPLAVVTGRPRPDAERFLQAHGIADLMQCLVCMHDAPAKPDPEPVRLCLQSLGVRHAWMVGDTPDDIRAARGAAVVPLGISPPGESPAHSRHVLDGVGAARVLEKLTDLQELLP